MCVLCFQQSIATAHAENLKLKNGNAYHVRQYRVMSEREIQIVDESQNRLTVKVQDIQTLITPKNWGKGLVAGALTGAYVGVAILGSTQFVVAALTKTPITLDPSNYLGVGALGALVGLGTGAVITFIAEDEFNDFKKLSLTDQMALLKEYEGLELQTHTVNIERPSRWHLIVQYALPSQVLFKNFQGKDYVYESPNGYGIGIEYERFLDDTWSWGLGILSSAKSISQEQLFSGGTLQSQNSYELDTIKPEIKSFRTSLHLFKYVAPQIQVFGGLNRNKIDSDLPLYTFKEINGFLGYDLGVNCFLTPKLSISLSYLHSNGFELQDKNSQQKTSQTEMSGLNTQLRWVF